MKKYISLFPLILIELIFFILIIFVNVNNSYIYCYSSIISIFIFVVFFFFKKKKYLVPLALLLTLAADLFLVLLGDAKYRTYGMFFFMLVQFTYGIYIYKEDIKHKNISLIARLIINIITITSGLIVLKGEIDLLAMFSLIYLANILSNIVACFLNLKKLYILLIALILFLLCDIYTGLVVASDNYFVFKENSLLYYIVNTDFNFTWFFYIPSQTMIAIHYYIY